MKECLLIVDIGTDYGRVVAMTPDYKVLAEEEQLLKLTSDNQGMVTCDALYLWETVRALLVKVTGKLKGTRFLALSITGQPHGTVLWDRETSMPVTPLITTRDKQAKSLCFKLREERREPMIHYRSGLFVEPTLPGAQLSWLLSENEALMKKAKAGELAWGTSFTWILWQLTGGTVHAIDAATASQTMLFDLSTFKWETQLLATFNVPGAILPKIGQSNDFFGETIPAHFGQALPVVAIAGEHQTSLFASGLKQPDEVLISYGDRTIIQVPRGYAPSIVSNFNSSIGWMMEGQPFFRLHCYSPGIRAAACWLNKHMSLPESFGGLIEMMPDADPDNELAVLPAFDGYNAPFFDPFARGMIVGITDKTGPADIAQALLLSQIHQSNQIVEVIEKMTKKTIKTMVIDGEGADYEWLLQTQADLLDKEVCQYTKEHLGWLGLACMAFVKLNGNDAQQVLTERLQGKKKSFTPQMDKTERQKKKHFWKEAFERGKGWSNS